MVTKEQLDSRRFFLAGINYKKSDAGVRGKFAIQNTQYASLLERSSSFGVTDLFVLSTCNRTEIYGFADDANKLIRLLCSETEGSAESFCKMSYVKNSATAIEHLFRVAAGLDSQILGDYEIVGQLKAAVKFSKERGCINVFTERLINSVLQSSKNIKSNTALSGGTVSVSFAAVQYIREHYKDLNGKNILLLGTGKIGRNTCKNLVDYLGTRNITLINRTANKASELAMEMGLEAASIEDLPSYIGKAEVILVATHSAEPLILRSHLESGDKKLIIDLSIPCNVEDSVRSLSNVTLINVDDLSKIKDKTLQRREAELPKATEIISRHLAEFNEWITLRKNVPVLTAVKSKLYAMQSCDMFINYSAQNKIPVVKENNSHKMIQQVINITANQMRTQNKGGCNFIEAINEFLEAVKN